ncbi:MAG: hypothetical protein QOG80_1364 [Pseudonocardiales bacterium]|nr:hypothetical protein [Pseudonocardiales bacterium]
MFGRKHVPALLAAIAIAAAALLATTPAGAAGSDPVLTGTDVSASSPDNGSTTTTSRGDTVEWVLSQLGGGAAAGHVSVTDPIPAGESYVPNSLQVPPGWTGSVSGGVVSAAGNVNATHQVSAPVAVPAPQFNTSVTNGGGDGYAPIPYGDNVYIIHHHTAGKIIKCFNKVTRVACAGFPKLVTPPPGFLVFGSATILDTYLDPSGQLYFPGRFSVVGTTATTPAIACIQLPAATPCASGGYALLSVPPTEAAMANGLVKIGSRLWTAVIQGSDPLALTCVDLGVGGSMTACPTSTPSVPALFDELISVNGALMGNATSYTGSGAIFPFAKNQPIYADGHTGPDLGPSSVPFRQLDSSGNTIGFCYQSYSDGQTRCVDGNANITDAPGALEALIGSYPGVGADFSFGYTPLVVGTKEYIDVWNFADLEVAGIKDSIVCFDWATNAACSSFGNTTTPGVLDTSTINGGHQHTYGMAVDDQNPQCGWAYGDARQLFNFQLVKGANCGGGQTSASVSLDAASYYCGVAPAGHHWTDVTLTGISAAQLSASSVTVKDADGNPVPGFSGVPLAADGTLDISSIPTTGSTAQLTVDLDVTTTSADPFRNGGKPTLTIGFDGPAGTVCFRAVNDTSCTALLPTGVTNAAHVVVDAAQFDPSAHLDIDPADPTNSSCSSASGTDTTSPAPPSSSPPPSSSGSTSPSYGIDAISTTRAVTSTVDSTGLARTGSPVGRLLEIAALLTLAGTALLLLVRPSRDRHEH